MILASAVLMAARDVHPAFDKQSTPDAPALRHLAQYQQGLLAAIAETKLDRVHVAQSFTMPLVNFDQGVTLNAYIRVHGATATPIDTQVPPFDVELVEYPLRLDDRKWADWRWKPRAYIEAGVMKLLGTAEDWNDIASVTVDLFPVGPDDLTMRTPLVLPGQPMRICVADLAAFMAVRAGVSVPDPLGARESYLDEVTERRRAKVGVIRDLW